MRLRSEADAPRGRVGEDDIEKLRNQGLSDVDVSDAIQVIGYFNYVTRVADGVGIEDGPVVVSLTALRA